MEKLDASEAVNHDLHAIAQSANNESAAEVHARVFEAMRDHNSSGRQRWGRREPGALHAVEHIVNKDVHTLLKELNVLIKDVKALM